MASISCAFCHNPVNPHDLGTWKKVSGWVHGPKRDSMTMREDTGEYAHTHCILKAKAGQPADQQEMFGIETPVRIAPPKEPPTDMKKLEDLLDE